jgi:signal transduction histidine kinase
VITLASSRFFGQLPAPDLAMLNSAARELRFQAGQEIFREGDPGDGVYLVKDGLVEISGALTALGRHVYSQASPGDIFGEMAVVDGQPRSAYATAASATVADFVPRGAVEQVLARSPALALALLREISQRLREFNRQYLRETLQSERLAVVGRFARSIVHDLKNPLNIIGITAEMAVMDQATAPMRQDAKKRIRRQVDRISDLISEILEFTQSTHSDFVLAISDYAVFVEQTLEEARPEVGLKSAQIEIEGEIPAVAVALNPKRLRRVFYNLFHNATDAMPMGGRILLRFKVTPAEVVTEIEDSGPGIAPEMLGRLFEAFATHGKTHGTGLGLSICKRIIEDHRGWIAARNEPGRGAVFSFALPRPAPGAS